MSKQTIRQFYLFSVFVACLMAARRESWGQVQVGQTAPGWAKPEKGLTDFDNNAVKLSDYARKNKSIVYFWTAATAQEVTQTLLPVFARRQDAVLLLVAIVDPNDPKYDKAQEIIRQFTQQYEDSGSVKFLKDSLLKLHDAYTGEEKRKAPRSAFVIDESGKVIARRVGKDREKQIEWWLDLHVQDPQQGILLKGLPAGTQVRVDGVDRTKDLKPMTEGPFLPLRMRENYEIEVTAGAEDKEYLSQPCCITRSITLSQRIEVEPQLPKKPRILVHVEPPDAKVEVEGIPSTELAKEDDRRVFRLDGTGTYEVIARKADLESKPQSVTLEANQKQDVTLIVPALIRVRVEETPDVKPTVKLDPAPTPRVTKLGSDTVYEFQVPPGNYVVTASREDYEPYKESVSARAGNVHSLPPVRLRPIAVSVMLTGLEPQTRVTAQTEGGVVEFRGVASDKGVISREKVKPGNYQIRLRHPGCEDSETSITVTPVNRTFPLSQKRRSGVWMKKEDGVTLRADGEWLKKEETPKPEPFANDVFFVALTPGDWTLRARKPGYAGRAQVTIPPDNWALGYLPSQPLTFDFKRVALITFHVQSPQPVEIRISDKMNNVDTRLTLTRNGDRWQGEVELEPSNEEHDINIFHVGNPKPKPGPFVERKKSGQSVKIYKLRADNDKQVVIDYDEKKDYFYVDHKQ